MRGHILGYDFRTGLGEIAGDDGQRYKFTGTEWREEFGPVSGALVDFEYEDSEARSIYQISARGGKKQPDKLIAGLLAIFIGALGIHKFYIGYNKSGIVMLLISIFGAILFLIPTIIMSIIAFIEGIIYLTKTDEEWEGEYLAGDKPWF